MSVTVFSASVSDSDSVFEADCCTVSDEADLVSSPPLSEQDKRDRAARISARDNEIHFYIKYPFLSVTIIVIFYRTNSSVNSLSNIGVEVNTKRKI